MSSFTYEGTLIELREAYFNRAWLALGYESWEAYVEAEHGFAPLRNDQYGGRKVVVRELREAGLSTRAIAAATGISARTVRRESPAPSNGKVTGLDGKGYIKSVANSEAAKRARVLADRDQIDWDGRPAVYFITNSRSGDIKIGHSSSPVQRLKVLQIGSVDILTIIGLAPGTVADEHRLHSMLQRHRIHGEWFKPHREVEAAMYYFLASGGEGLQ